MGEGTTTKRTSLHKTVPTYSRARPKNKRTIIGEANRFYSCCDVQFSFLLKQGQLAVVPVDLNLVSNFSGFMRSMPDLKSRPVSISKPNALFSRASSFCGSEPGPDENADRSDLRVWSGDMDTPIGDAELPFDRGICSSRFPITCTLLAGFGGLKRIQMQTKLNRHSIIADVFFHNLSIIVRQSLVFH